MPSKIWRKKLLKKYKNSTVNANQIYNFTIQCNMNENETSYSPNLWHPSSIPSIMTMIMAPYLHKEQGRKDASKESDFFISIQDSRSVDVKGKSNGLCN